jgi:phage shock protein A
MKLELLLQYLPATVAVVVVLVAAGMLGLFRALALSKTSYDNTVESLQRQLAVITKENEGLQQQVMNLESSLALLRDATKDTG